VIGLLMVSATMGQDMDRAPDRARVFTVRGEISTSSPLIGGYTVELARNSGLGESVPLSIDGTFEFRSAQDGVQELRVLSPRGEVIHRQTVVINGPQQLLAIRLPENTSVPRSGSNTVSLQQLQHKVPPEAKKAFDRGQRLVAENKYSEAITAFRQAVTVDPEYADGLNELGVVEAATGDLEHAAEHFQKAVDLAPEHSAALPNLSIALAKLKRFHEAAEVARRAIKVVPDSGRVRYILAACILIEHGDPEEALVHLERATGEVPKAHLVAADVLVILGRPQEAIRHLEEFLKIAPPDDKDRPGAEARLASLKH
jgi:tetratricopeptide (TPR) repeat protein